MKFRFAFEIVLKHKRTVEDAARRDLAQCQVNLAKAESDLKALYDAITDSRQLGHDLQTQASSHSQRQAPRLVQIDHFILGQHLRIGTQKSKVREFKAIYEEAQEVVIAAAKERKIYEKLREQRLEDFKQDAKKRELKQVDELVVTRFNSGERKL